VSNPLHAANYADRAVFQRATVIENKQLARDTFRIRFECAQIAQRIVPGQFLMLRVADCNDPLLGRPLALYDTVLDGNGHPRAVDVVYLVLGKMTHRLAQFSAGQQLDVWGPLGNGFSAMDVKHLVMVAGGIGQTPFMALAREYFGQRRYGEPAQTGARADQVTLCYGARSSDYLAGVEDFRNLGVEVRVSTDDGSAGHHGLVTDLLKQVLSESADCHFVCCGPEPMMKAVSEIAGKRKVPCQVSLETPMACGIGICFSCVAKVRDAHGDWDYKRTCVEGPVFDAAAIEW
jgi:dihydroorotate dehydrogenase electron transfer subunit